MRVLEVIAGIAILFGVLLDAFETVVLPRRATRRFRLARLFYRTTWTIWRTFARSIRSPKLRETILSYYGPSSLLALISVWAVALVFGFAFLLLAAGPPAASLAGQFDFFSAIYMSGTNFFTLGLDDAIPKTSWSRFLSVFEAGIGFGFLAAIIGYLPVIYQGFSRREVAVVLLDARAGSPPSAAELLRRHAHPLAGESLTQLFRDWERSSADILESHISYPVLLYYRSQHDNESWLGALTAILDASALTIVSISAPCTKQAQLTFAMARHAIVDLAQIFRAQPQAPEINRLPPADLLRIRELLTEAGLEFSSGPAEDEKLKKLRAMYEPYVNALSEYLAIALPPWIHKKAITDNWKTSAWGRISGTLADDGPSTGVDDH
jgi:Ion channel